MSIRHRKYLILAFAAAVLGMITVACGAATPTGDCLVPQNGKLVASDCTVPQGATAIPTATATPAQGTPTSNGNLDPAAAGKQVYQTHCSFCHTTDGSASTGPTWKGLYGSTVTLSDGTKVTADDAYIHESIVDPSAKVVKGFPDNVMPKTFGTQLSATDISNIIAYIKTLK